MLTSATYGLCYFLFNFFMGKRLRLSRNAVRKTVLMDQQLPQNHKTKTSVGKS